MENWFAVYEDATGVLLSVGTVISSPLAAGLVAVFVGTVDPIQNNMIWDSTRRMFMPAPPDPAQRDLALEIRNHATLSALSVSARTAVLTAATDILESVGVRFI
jgi:hypothetical protein